MKQGGMMNSNLVATLKGVDYSIIEFEFRRQVWSSPPSSDESVSRLRGARAGPAAPFRSTETQVRGRGEEKH
jgi:hypothetical protein